MRVVEFCNELSFIYKKGGVREMEGFILALFIGIIPAIIAKNKGKNPFLWYIYGVLLFIVALPHALIMKSNYQCPHCRSNIDPEATVCPRCSKDII